MNWKPTNELRFLKRSVPLVGIVCMAEIKLILQQKWECFDDYLHSIPVEIEWRDVPVVEE